VSEWAGTILDSSLPASVLIERTDPLLGGPAAHDEPVAQVGEVLHPQWPASLTPACTPSGRSSRSGWTAPPPRRQERGPTDLDHVVVADDFISLAERGRM
jgi:hypothetical protein